MFSNVINICPSRIQVGEFSTTTLGEFCITNDIGEKLVKKPTSRQDHQWKERDKAALQYVHNLRPLFIKIDFDSNILNNPLLEAIEWMKQVFTKNTP